MKIAFFGDIVGKVGRNAVCEYVKALRNRIKVDCVIVNGENSAHGFGIRQNICDQFFEAGIDVITLGNHSFDQKEDLQLYDREKKLIRPLNYPKGTPGHGYCLHDIPSLGKKLLVVNVIGRSFMELNDDPFVSLEDLLKLYKLRNNVDAIFVDMHAETTAEKAAFSRYFDGRISAIIGTHTHIPTADPQVLPKGTAFLSDAGMCGDYNTVIGMDQDAAIKRFIQKTGMFAKMTPGTGEATVCGALVELDNTTGLAKNIQTIKVGGCLFEQRDV